MIEVSIVSGTYNRLNLLKDMVASIRRSVGTLGYEIVLVDGGSTDGTDKWCAEQSDIKFIQQGKLLGGVRAFNEGAENALGRYVILANDDIEFLGIGIQIAVTFMDMHPTVGIGCFSQNRYGPSYSVGMMPAIKNGKRVSVPYGQVCIVQRWLGDLVGWWGDYLHTYAGDNELSCNVYELGFSVTEVPNARINDKVHKDILRDINNPNKSGEQHPDSAKWVAKWTKPEGLGPYIRPNPLIDLEIVTRPRLLYAPIYERGSWHGTQMRYKVGLRKALEKYFMVYESDYITNGCSSTVSLADASRPQVVLLQVHDERNFTIQAVDSIRKIVPNAVIINWNGDYHKETLLNEGYVRLMGRFDLATFVTTNYFELYRTKRVNPAYWQVSWEECTHLPVDNPEEYDVVFLGNCYSQARVDLGKVLTSIPNLKFTVYGLGWERAGIKSKGDSLYDIPIQDKIYRSAKIAIGECQWPESIGYVSNRMFQELYAGSFILQQNIPQMTELMGFEDGKHMVVWHSFDELKHLISYWADDKHKTQREEIAKAGHEFALKYHSFENRVEELKGWIQKILSVKLQRALSVPNVRESLPEKNY